MPGMKGLELCPSTATRNVHHHDHRLWRRVDETQGAEEWRLGLLTKPIDFETLRSEIDMCVERAA